MAARSYRCRLVSSLTPRVTSSKPYARVSATLAADGSAILVHCLSTDDPDSVRDEIKTRYERRLLEIFP